MEIFFPVLALPFLQTCRALLKPSSCLDATDTVVFERDRPNQVLSVYAPKLSQTQRLSQVLGLFSHAAGLSYGRRIGVAALFRASTSGVRGSSS